MIELLQSFSQSSQASIEISTVPVVKTKHIKYTTQPGGYYNSIILHALDLPPRQAAIILRFPGNPNSDKNVRLDASHINDIIVAQQSYEFEKC